jgi:hypothetical protein
MGGGLLKTPFPKRLFSPVLRAGADVSWLPRVMAGDDQGNVGACAMFAMASWAEIMFGSRISDQDRLDAYAAACKRLGRGDEGLYFPEAFEQAQRCGWLPGRTRIEATVDLGDLVEQPILAGYTVTPAWERPNAAGCLDHAASDEDLGGHATVIVAHGIVFDQSQTPIVFVENSWGTTWGWKGLCQMTEGLHRMMCNELWVIR